MDEWTDKDGQMDKWTDGQMEGEKEATAGK